MVAVNPVSAPLVGFRRMWVFGSESRLFFQRFQRSILETRWVSHGPWNRSTEAVFAIGGYRTEKLEKLEVAGQSWKPSLGCLVAVRVAAGGDLLVWAATTAGHWEKTEASIFVDPTTSFQNTLEILQPALIARPTPCASTLSTRRIYHEAIFTRGEYCCRYLYRRLGSPRPLRHHAVCRPA